MPTLLFPYDKFSFNYSFLLDQLSEEEQKKINQEKKTLSLKRKHVLFHEGTLPSGIYILRKGFVKKYTIGLQGKETIFKISREGEVLGYKSVITNKGYPYSACCITDCTIEYIQSNLFTEILNKSSDFTMLLLKNIISEYGAFMNEVKILSQHNVRERVAISLIKLNSLQETSCERIKLSRRDHSSFVGTSTESLIRVLNDFKEEGIIEVKESEILIKNFNKLLNVSNYI